MALHPGCEVSFSDSFGGRYVHSQVCIPAHVVILEETPMWTLNASSSSSATSVDDACSSFAPSHLFADLVEGVDDDDVDVMIAILREPAKLEPS